MSNQRRKVPLTPALPPLTPESCAAPAPAPSANYKGKAPSAEAELKFLRVILASERRKHSTVEGILGRLVASLEHQVAQLERQVGDMRTAYLSTFKFQITPKEN